MNNPLHVELTQLRQQELQKEAQTRRQHTVTQQNPLSSTFNTVLNTLTRRVKEVSTTEVDETAHLAWLADQA